MSIWKKEGVKPSKTEKEQNRTPFYEMSPSERSEALENYSEWVDNTIARADYTIAKMETEGYITNEIALDLISRIEKYFLEIEFSGEIINKVEDLENKLFEGIFVEVEKGSGLASGITSIRESVYKASKYKKNMFTLNVLEFKAQKEAKAGNEPTTLEDHLEDSDTSDKEVSTSSSSKKGRGRPKGSKNKKGSKK